VVGICAAPPWRDGKWRDFFDFFDFFVCFVGATVSLARLLSMLPGALVSFGTVTHRQRKQRACCN